MRPSPKEAAERQAIPSNEEPGQFEFPSLLLVLNSGARVPGEGGGAAIASFARLRLSCSGRLRTASGFQPLQLELIADELVHLMMNLQLGRRNLSQQPLR